MTKSIKTKSKKPSKTPTPVKATKSPKPLKAPTAKPLPILKTLTHTQVRITIEELASNKTLQKIHTAIRQALIGEPYERATFSVIRVYDSTHQLTDSAPTRR